jgi:hypothetical protein
VLEPKKGQQGKLEKLLPRLISPAFDCNVILHVRNVTLYGIKDKIEIPELSVSTVMGEEQDLCALID